MMRAQERAGVFYTPALGRAIAKAAREPKVGWYHIISSVLHAGKWSLVRSGSFKVLKNFSTTEAAVNFAKKLNRGTTKGVYVHNEMGGLQSKISFEA